MSNLRIFENPSQMEWASFVDASAIGNLMQMFEYGEVVKMSNARTRIVRLLAVNAGQPVAIVQGRYNRRFGFGDRLEVGGVYGIGPLVGDVSDKEHVFRELIATLEIYSLKRHVAEAYICRPAVDPILEDMGYSLTTVFNVYRVPLPKSVDELWRNLASNKRRNIKKAQERGAEVVDGVSSEYLGSFYELYCVAAKRVGFAPQPFRYFDSYLKILGASGKVRIFLVLFGGDPVAGVFVVTHGDTAYALGAGSRKEIWHIRPNDMLHWKAMDWACKSGFSYYHMGHVDEPPPTEGSAGWGLWRWKREWRGQLEKRYLYHKIYMPRFKRFFLTPYEKLYRYMRKVYS